VPLTRTLQTGAAACSAGLVGGRSNLGIDRLGRSGKIGPRMGMGGRVPRRTIRSQRLQAEREPKDFECGKGPKPIPTSNTPESQSPNVTASGLQYARCGRDRFSSGVMVAAWPEGGRGEGWMHDDKLQRVGLESESFVPRCGRNDAAATGAKTPFRSRKRPPRGPYRLGCRYRDRPKVERSKPRPFCRPFRERHLRWACGKFIRDLPFSPGSEMSTECCR